jgi:hypothetical protein
MRAAGESMDRFAFSCGQGTAWMPGLGNAGAIARARSKNPARLADLSACLGGMRQSGGLSFFSLLRTSCPPPFGSASLFAHASCACGAARNEAIAAVNAPHPTPALQTPPPENPPASAS